jgi:hypothetical protein
LEKRLVRIVRETPWLVGVRELALPDWYVGGGVVRNLVWDYLHGYAEPSWPGDVDVAYFDAENTSRERDILEEERLRRLLPDIRWDVKNQAGVHEWFEELFGYPVSPLSSTREAVATWPETASAVALTLTPSDEIEVYAPLGLEDLFDMVVRRNPARVTAELYVRRIAEKRYAERWPKVRIVYPDPPAV